MIKLYGLPTTPIYIVGNKCDLSEPKKSNDFLETRSSFNESNLKTDFIIITYLY